MVSAINQAVLKQLRLRIEIDHFQYPGKRKLKINGKELVCVPPEVFMLNNDIEILDLSPEREACLSFHMDEVPTDIGRMYNLTVLMLDTNEISYIPDEICKLVKLERLSLSNNYLSELPKSFSKLKNMKSLHMSNNNIDEFPSVICRLPQLEFLDLSDNYISILPPEIGNLKKLESLMLFINELETLPDSICELEDLRTLWIGNNKISELPRNFGDLHELDWGTRHTPSPAIDGNPLVHPPLDVCKRGIDHIAIYLKEHARRTSETST